MGSWHLNQKNQLQVNSTSSGPKTLKLKVMGALRRQESLPKKIPRPVALNQKKLPLTQIDPNPKTEANVSPVEAVTGGNSSQGTTDHMAVFKAELRAMIDRNKYYPPVSRRLGHTGTVVVSFTLLPDGHIIDVRLEKPSRYDRLNESALDAVKKVQKFRPIPKEIADGRMDIQVPVNFITI